eukprot:15335508-Ditylum_brightwellii.AAC.1
MTDHTVIIFNLIKCCLGSNQPLRYKASFVLFMGAVPFEAKYRALHYCSTLGSLPPKVLFSFNPRETLSSLPPPRHSSHRGAGRQPKLLPFPQYELTCQPSTPTNPVSADCSMHAFLEWLVQMAHCIHTPKVYRLLYERTLLDTPVWYRLLYVCALFVRH